MADDLSNTSERGLTTTQWLICTMAAIGFAFDIYELLMLPLIIKDVISALKPPGAGPSWVPGGEDFNHWGRLLFFVPAIAGGIFGLLGGYLTDRLGRRRVLTGSILLYAGAATAAGFATSLEVLLFFRCLVFIGVCVEFVAAVAWLAELFHDPVQREKVIGYTQAFSSFGGMLVAAVAGLISRYATLLPAIYDRHEAWRYTLISGLIPAIPLIIIRPFLPESPDWERKKAEGTLKRPSIAELFSPALAKTTIVTTLLFASTFGLAFGAIQQTPQILSAHVDVKSGAAKTVDGLKAAAESAGEQWTEKNQTVSMANAGSKITADVQFIQEIGGLIGRFALAFLVVKIVSRRTLFRVFQIPSLILLPLFYWWLSNNLQTAGTLTFIKFGMFLCGFFVIAQMSFWGNYIPHAFPLHLRGTGESFAANIGGRLIGTAAAFITLTLAASKPPNLSKMALVGACVAGAYAIVGFLLTFFLPEHDSGRRVES
ncbi:MAG TPA: MFS transporter [Caulifigura sp.]|jgi:MFS family permease|nr:MFS transporter [Caulifigura sp.]